MPYHNRDLKIADNDIEQLAKACLENAKSLLADAKLLLKHKRNPRAYALTVIALEELAKIPLLTILLFSPTWNDTNWKRFHNYFNNHRVKQRTWLPSKISRKHSNQKSLKKEDVLSMEGLKQFAFYVGYFNRDLIVPNELFVRSKKRIVRLLAFAEDMITREKSLLEKPDEFESNKAFVEFLILCKKSLEQNTQLDPRNVLEDPEIKMAYSKFVRIKSSTANGHHNSQRLIRYSKRDQIKLIKHFKEMITPFF